MSEKMLGVENLADRGAGATSYCLCSRENDTGIEELDLRSTVAADASGLVSGMYYCAGCRSSEPEIEALDASAQGADGARMCYPCRGTEPVVEALDASAPGANDARMCYACGITEPVLEALDASHRGGEGARICHGPCHM